MDQAKIDTQQCHLQSQKCITLEVSLLPDGDQFHQTTMPSNNETNTANWPPQGEGDLDLPPGPWFMAHFATQDWIFKSSQRTINHSDSNHPLAWLHV